MTSQQYEELCRLYLADRFRISIDRIESRDHPNPLRPGTPEYHHQIDLYWEIETADACYVHIANAKWRTPPALIGLADVLLLQQVKTKLAAHKAFLITSTGYSADAIAAAADEGIALHVLTSHLDTYQFRTRQQANQSHTQSKAASDPSGPQYAGKVVHKAMPKINKS
jgi:hypothetical protein